MKKVFHSGHGALFQTTKLLKCVLSSVTCNVKR